MFTGKQFGRYEIRAKIGAGGMGEIYAAYDQELDRNAAVKFLPAEFSQDETRKSRFRQEARAASALNHPNIITIYEIGENEHGCYMVTELIDGNTLREAVRIKPLSLSALLKLIEQAANALVAAHGAHIVHRDIKPENIMVRRDGIVKILDFGLAKPTAQKVSGDSKDQELVNTIPGMIMGSARYMSPEQARGQAVDERSDIWSLGVVLYEMVAGNPPFEGTTTGDTIAAVIYKEPEALSNTVDNIPAELQRIVRKALQKDPDERYQSVKDLALDLKDLIYDLEHQVSIERMRPVITDPALSDPAINENQTMIHQTNSANHTVAVTNPSKAGLSLAPEAQQPKKKNLVMMLAASLGGIILLAILSYGLYSWFTSNNKNVLFEKTQFSRIDSDGKVILPAISPDGKYLAYSSGDPGNRSLMVRQIATNSAVTTVPASNLELRSIVFSPSGDHIYYTQMRSDFSLNTLYQVPTLGGTPKRLIEDVDSAVTFSPDGKQFAFLRHVSGSDEDLIIIVNTDTLENHQLMSSKQTSFNSFASRIAWSPDGKKFLLGVGVTSGGLISERKVAEVSIAEKTVKLIGTKSWFTANNFIWLKDGSGFLFCGQETRDSPSQIWRASYPGGEVRAITNDFNYYNEIGLTADNNTIVAIKGESVSSLWRFSPATKEKVQLTPESKSLDGNGGFDQMPDGKLVITRQAGNNVDLWLLDSDFKNAVQLTRDLGYIYGPRVTPDGKYIIFGSQNQNTSQIWRIDADGKNITALTPDDPNNSYSSPQITADGKTVIFHRNPVADEDQILMKVPVEGGKIEVFHSEDHHNIFVARLSPNGKHVVYSAYEIDTLERKLRVASINGDVFGQVEHDLPFNLIERYFWAPDSKSITISSNRSGVSNIFQMPLDGGNPVPLTDFTSGRIFHFHWSRDGKNIFIVRGIVSNELLLIRDQPVGATAR